MQQYVVKTVYESEREVPIEVNYGTFSDLATAEKYAEKISKRLKRRKQLKYLFDPKTKVYYGKSGLTLKQSQHNEEEYYEIGLKYQSKFGYAFITVAKINIAYRDE